MSWTITPQTKVPVDPFRSQVSLLLHGNPDGSGNILDSSPTPKTISKFGNAASATPPSYPNSNSAFGNAIALDGTGDYLTVPVSSDLSFGTSDFTLECWFYIAANSSPDIGNNRNAALVSSANGFSNFMLLAILGNPTTTGTALSFQNFAAGVGNEILYTGTIAKTTWHHVAVVRSGTTTSIYFNGTSVASGTLTGQAINQVNPTWIGGLNLTGYNNWFNGYIDDLRITKGIARYTANFSVPTAQFPDI
jgi:hypothetical protein